MYMQQTYQAEDKFKPKTICKMRIKIHVYAADVLSRRHGQTKNYLQVKDQDICICSRHIKKKTSSSQKLLAG